MSKSKAPDTSSVPVLPPEQRVPKHNSESSIESKVSAHIRRLRETLLTYIGVSTVLIGILIYFGINDEAFISTSNLTNVLQTNAVLLLAAVGVTFTLLVGGFDLSVGGVIALSSVVLVKLVNGGMPDAIAIAIVVIGAGLFGTIVNGILIAKAGVNFFVVTLGTSAITLSLALALSNGATISFERGGGFIRDIGSQQWGFMPVSALIALCALVLGIMLLRYTGFGRLVYAVGGNPEAARLSGINVSGIKMSAYGISALLAGVGGVIATGFLASASATSNTGIELTAAAAVLLGGTSFIGGVGTLLGTFLGVTFLAVLANGLTLSEIPTFYSGLVTGVVLVLSVTLDRYRQLRVERRGGS